MADCDKPVLYVVDAAESAVDPLRLLTRAPATLRCRLDHPALRWRAALELARRSPRGVVAWGARPFQVAVLARVRRGIVRPHPGDRQLPRPTGNWHVAATSEAEARALCALGWDNARCHVVPPPGEALDVPARSARAGDRGARGDFLWMLLGDPGPDSGLRPAIWAATIVHVTERATRPHRLLLWGDTLDHRRGRRFVDQLGLPELFLTVPQMPYARLMEHADAFVFLPRGTSGPWSASVAAMAGLPGVAADTPVMREFLGRQDNVQLVSDLQPRVVAREMLRLSERPRRLPGDARFASSAILARWEAAVAASC